MTERIDAEDRRTTCNSQNNNVHVVELPETTFLLSSSERRSNNCCDKTMFFCLILILVVGISIGTYLLCVEGETDVPEKVIIVPRTDWSDEPDFLNVSRLSLPTRRLLITQSNSNECRSKTECYKELRNLQSEHMEKLKEPAIAYNFMFGGDGRIYEGRGWRYRSAFQVDDENILTVAFLGNYDSVAPSTEQRKELKAFLDYAIMKETLVPCFNILVRASVSRYLLDVVYAIEEQEKLENMC